MRNYRTLTTEELAELERLYPNVPNRELAKQFNISVDALVKHIAKPSGWGKSKEFGRKYRYGKEKKELSQKELNWFKQHFKHTKNAEIAERLGITLYMLHTLARKYGLTKSVQFKKKIQKESSIKGCEIAKQYGIYEENSARCKKAIEEKRAQGIPVGFPKGVSNIERFGWRKNKLRIERSKIGWRKAYDSDRRRAMFGMEQKTKWRFTFKKISHTAVSHKSAMIRHCGYFSDREHPSWVLYDESTKRSEKREETARKHGLRVLEYAKECRKCS